MPIDPATALALAQVATGIAGAVFSSKSADNNRLKMSPEEEVAYLNNLQQQLKQSRQGQQQSTQLLNAYNKRMDVIDGVIKGTMPSKQAMQQLTSAANDIAMTFGSPEEAKARGYLSEADFNDLQSISTSNIQDRKDVGLENQLNSERAALEQNLARSGVGPAQRLQALNQFNKLADERRYQSNQEAVQKGLAVVGARSNLRQQTFGNIQTQIQNGLTGAGQLAGTNQARYTAAQTDLQNQAALRGERNAAYEQLGKTDISGVTNNYLKGGTIGPGTLQGQTGVAPNYPGSWFDGVIGKTATVAGFLNPTQIGVNVAEGRKIAGKKIY